MALDLEQVRGIAERVAASYGLNVLEIEFRGGGKSRMLRIFLDRPDGKVTHDDCANVSRDVSTILDVEDTVPGSSYTLEVSSPGMDRKLYKAADYERFAGRLVKIKTIDPVRDSQFFEGRLEGLREGRVVVDITDRGRGKKPRVVGVQEDGGHVEIELANVEKANLVPEF
jgi:ribosome maturation factor RimP